MGERAELEDGPGIPLSLPTSLLTTSHADAADDEPASVSSVSITGFLGCDSVFFLALAEVPVGCDWGDVFCVPWVCFDVLDEFCVDTAF